MQQQVKYSTFKQQQVKWKRSNTSSKQIVKQKPVKWFSIKQ